MVRSLLFAAAVAVVVTARSEVTVDGDGRRWECKDGICRIIDDGAADPPRNDVGGYVRARMVCGWRNADEMLDFLAGVERTSPFREDASFLWLLLVFFVGGIALNLTPCVLPMIPVNLIVIGRSVRRALAYGLGLFLAMGTLGLCAAFGSLAFGEIQSSPLFNAVVAFVFLALAVALCGGFAVDFSRWRSALAPSAAKGLGVFFLGVLSATLAGACVAPIVIAALVFTAKLHLAGNRLAVLLPFALGLGLALPWPLLGMGLRVLPRPGAWMRQVNRVFALFVFALAVWYGMLAWRLWRGAEPAGGEVRGDVIEAVPSTFASALSEARGAGRPVFVDCWASWCKNCAAMERTTLRDPRVVSALSGFVTIRLRAESPSELKQLPDFADVPGLPAYLIFDSKGGKVK